MKTNKPPLKNHYFSGDFLTNLVTLHRTIADSDQLKITFRETHSPAISASPFFLSLHHERTTLDNGPIGSHSTEPGMLQVGLTKPNFIAIKYSKDSGDRTKIVALPLLYHKHYHNMILFHSLVL